MHRGFANIFVGETNHLMLGYAAWLRCLLELAVRNEIDVRCSPRDAADRPG